MRQLLFTQKEEPKLVEIPITCIRPNRSQPRRVFAEDELCSLAQSIASNGILQPLTVRRVSQSEYELIAGERRLRASIMVGLQKVPCIVMKCSDRQSAVYALLENLQRADLNMFEEARAIRKLILDCSLTQERVAKQLGKKQSTIANKLRLLRLNEEEQEKIIDAGLTERHARVLLKLDGEQRKQVLEKAVSGNLNVKQTEILVERALQQSKTKGQHAKIIIKDVRIFMNTLNKAIDTMRLSGIDALTEKKENDEYIEYNVRIPKSSAYKQSGSNISA
ncbi:MAG: ParB/RepB/Spo0J family partition protein [Acutalibacteraceae bacterium]|nr:ParB/RepB/Spo0J family partition protein [Acutalibacteraceae bacterium]